MPSCRFPVASGLHLSARGEVSGHVVYAGDVDRALAQHPAVADAGVAAHEGTGTAFVVLATGQTASETELVEFCRARLAPHEVPSSVTFVDQLPRSSVGKLLRHELAALVASDQSSGSDAP
jgi:acyl-coenzyme A synthetase/AMP-(fatty) acid ligase